jgi:hypothetical protein
LDAPRSGAGRRLGDRLDGRSRRSFLTQNLGQAFDLALETKDPRYPALHAFCNPTRKLGADAADFTYVQAWVDNKSIYKISGNRGNDLRKWLIIVAA